MVFASPASPAARLLLPPHYFYKFQFVTLIFLSQYVLTRTPMTQPNFCGFFSPLCFQNCHLLRGTANCSVSTFSLTSPASCCSEERHSVVLMCSSPYSRQENVTKDMYVYDLRAYVQGNTCTIMKSVSQSIIQAKDRFCCPA